MPVAPLANAWLGTGVALALLTPWGLLRYWWTTIKLTNTVVLTVVVLLVLVPRLGAAADAARATTPHTFTAEERTPLLLAPVVASSLLALNVALAIYKPRWRVRRDAGELRQTRPSYA
jgi:L-asparagine transporter-like permease